ncbi:MAG: tRNA preQ1(34) S-adenosylmethionine ribosyltransferase-isomerase QueA [Granulosicoccus sp.]
MQLQDFHFDLPPELIAQQPLPTRSASRLLVLATTGIAHRQFSELPNLLNAGDHLVFNDTRVIPARLMGHKASGGMLEMMLERVLPGGRVLAKLRASKSPKPGARLFLVAGEADSSSGDTAKLEVEVVARHDDLFELTAPNNALPAFIEAHGAIPLPPYINRAPAARDALRYQTVFAREPGAVAAPTAGLHFDQELLDTLSKKLITSSFVTLHVGAGTFQPVRVDDLSQHTMHAERVSVPAATVEAIQRTRANGGKVIAVGTTSVRALEAAAAADENEHLAAWSGETRLFLTPGSTFRVIDGMITNFHLSESTLLMLVSAFAGHAETLAAYREAVAQRYRFFSYGDAMLVWPKKFAESPAEGLQL